MIWSMSSPEDANDMARTKLLLEIPGIRACVTSDKGKVGCLKVIWDDLHDCYSIEWKPMCFDGDSSINFN